MAEPAAEPAWDRGESREDWRVYLFVITTICLIIIVIMITNINTDTYIYIYI